MNKINDDLKFYGNYFNGIKDIKEHKSIGQVTLGILKIVSLATIVLPIIFGVGYIIAESKLNNLSELYTRVSQSFEPEFKSARPTQKEYIKFLFAKTQDNEYSLFEKCFRQLESSSQNSFFRKTAQNGCLIECMKQTPKDLEKIEFNLGSFLSPCDFKKANALIDKFIEGLVSFQNQKEIVVDMTGVASLTQNAESNLRLLEEFKESNTSFSDEVDVVMLSSTYGEPNNLGGAKRMLYGLVKHLQQSIELEYIDVLFTNKKVRIQKNNKGIKITVDNILNQLDLGEWKPVPLFQPFLF